MKQTIEENKKYYDLFLKFTGKYTPAGFYGIDHSDPLLCELEALMKVNRQFFIIADLIQIKILFATSLCRTMIGIDPSEVTPYHFFEATHPDDIQRHNLGRTKLFRIAQDMFIAKNGTQILSTNFRLRNTELAYTNMLIQCYIFYTKVPVSTIYLLQVQTDIDWYRKIRHGYHYYVGSDLSFFRYPDDDLLKTGNVFSDREFEIIRLILSGLDSEQIAEKLFLSVYTVNTHRRNILKKTGEKSISELIYNLKERGLL